MFDENRPTLPASVESKSPFSNSLNPRLQHHFCGGSSPDSSDSLSTQSTLSSLSVSTLGESFNTLNFDNADFMSTPKRRYVKPPSFVSAHIHSPDSSNSQRRAPPFILATKAPKKTVKCHQTDTASQVTTRPHGPDSDELPRCHAPAKSSASMVHQMDTASRVTTRSHGPGSNELPGRAPPKLTAGHYQAPGIVRSRATQNNTKQKVSYQR